MQDAPPPATAPADAGANLPSDFRIAQPDADGRVVIDLMPVEPYRRCPAPVAGEITVCAEDPNRYRYNRDFDTAGSDEADEASISLGDGVKLQAEVESVNIGGFTSNRVMLRLKIKM